MYEWSRPGVLDQSSFFDCLISKFQIILIVLRPPLELQDLTLFYNELLDK